MELGGTQENEELQVGLPVSTAAQGRVVSSGPTIGILMHLGRESNQARVRIYPADIQPLSMGFSIGGVEISSIPNLEWVASQRIRSEEDARVLEILDSIANIPNGVESSERQTKTKSQESRPVFKTRYQRILGAIEELLTYEPELIPCQLVLSPL
jgi:hypothetical protein